MASRTGSADREVTGMTSKGDRKTENNGLFEEEQVTNVDLGLQSGHELGGKPALAPGGAREHPLQRPIRTCAECSDVLCA